MKPVEVVLSDAQISQAIAEFVLRYQDAFGFGERWPDGRYNVAIKWEVSSTEGVRRATVRLADSTD